MLGIVLQKCKSTFQNWFWIGISHSVGQVPANTLSLTSPCTRTPTCYAAWVWRRCKRLNLTRATPKGSKEDRTGMPLIGLCAKFFLAKFDSDLIELLSYCFTPHSAWHKKYQNGSSRGQSKYDGIQSLVAGPPHKGLNSLERFTNLPLGLMSSILN